MPFRILVVAATVAVSACAEQDIPPLPVHSAKAPSQASVSQAQGACPNATFVTVAPHDNKSLWFKC